MVQAESVDLGVVEAHRKIECGFAITNDSPAAWFVQGARSSCACMAVEVRQGELRAGEVLPVRVAFDPQGMEGAVEKSVWVEIKSRAAVVRNYRAQVRLRLGYKPRDVAFGVVKPSAGEQSIVAKLTGFASDAATVTVEPPSIQSIFDVRIDENRRDLRVSLRSDRVPQGTYCEMLKIKSLQV